VGPETKEEFNIKIRHTQLRSARGRDDKRQEISSCLVRHIIGRNDHIREMFDCITVVLWPSYGPATRRNDKIQEISICLSLVSPATGRAALIREIFSCYI
jgi:hypothetical protein